MKGKSRWDERPHLNPHGDPNAVTICRLAPAESAASKEILLRCFAPGTAYTGQPAAGCSTMRTSLQARWGCSIRPSSLTEMISCCSFALHSTARVTITMQTTAHFM